MDSPWQCARRAAAGRGPGTGGGSHSPPQCDRGPVLAGTGSRGPTPGVTILLVISDYTYYTMYGPRRGRAADTGTGL